eukprot:CAMPEP_0179972886 /NCGR_PEP_ID=MMETSP0983-20121128/37027_1 /TAXON_ID=483367 /ORGANISM="non described non described, Strain CCMP 2436" /LENGTH=44 /DNA_ID= /DNA_START= /DNA_END= /DNA_ORIENTATION=
MMILALRSRRAESEAALATRVAYACGAPTASTVLTSPSPVCVVM